MGTYLSTPVTEKHKESGDYALQEATNANEPTTAPPALTPPPSLALSWGMVDMQGWRKNMEDAHVASTGQLTLKDTPVHVFGVFDGHGGPEVARLCQLYTVSVLEQTLQESNMEQAMIQTFHYLDDMINDPHRKPELLELKNLRPLPGEARQAVIPVLNQYPPAREPETEPEPVENGHATAEEDPTTTADENDNTTPTLVVSTIDDTLPPEQQDEEPQNDIETDKDDNKDEEDSDDDSTEQVGLEQAIAERDDLEEEDPMSDGPSNDSPVTRMFRNFFHPNATGPNTHKARPILRSALVPTIVQNGRQICNLPEHPSGIYAGCTAILAVLVGRTLTVANAGDSRAVLCQKGGTARPLSFDHKPQQEGELTRIVKAGGFVNHFGRVNGNLNLSRSIGDLKYKQGPHLPPAHQMITAEPDVLEVELDPDDEFIILGCDGIWDCLSNEQAVDFVRSRIDEMPLTELGALMLDTIISDDPRATQGIGGDNMTVLIVDLQPNSRSHRTTTANETTNESAVADEAVVSDENVAIQDENDTAATAVGQ